MDLVYVPEVLTYGFYRAPQYRDYEQPWNKDYFNYGKSTPVHSQRAAQQQHEQKAVSKETCYLCRENKRRSLAAYIRGKSRSNSCHEIHEEEEEHEAAATEQLAVSPDDAHSQTNETLNNDESLETNSAAKKPK